MTRTSLSAMRRCLAKIACIMCGACVEACPTLAREIVGREVNVDELIGELLADRLHVGKRQLARLAEEGQGLSLELKA